MRFGDPGSTFPNAESPNSGSRLRITTMALDVAAVQDRLRNAGLDGWLLYDFHGSNPIAARLAGLTGGVSMTTRRWYYLIPASGQPRGLVHAIERHNLDALPGERMVYSGRQQLDAGLTRLLSGLKIVAMEYSPLLRDSLYFTRGRRNGGDGACEGRRDRLVWGSRPTVRSGVDERTTGDAPGRIRIVVPYKRSGLWHGRRGARWWPSL